jgi:hypothetical protein
VLELRPEVLGQVASILARYIVFHLERTLRAPAFLEKLQRARPAAAQSAEESPSWK